MNHGPFHISILHSRDTLTKTCAHKGVLCEIVSRFVFGNQRKDHYESYVCMRNAEFRIIEY